MVMDPSDDSRSIEPDMSANLPDKRMVNCVKFSCQRRWMVRILAWQALVSVIIMFLSGRAMSLFSMFENKFKSGVLIIGCALPPLNHTKVVSLYIETNLI